MKTLLLTLFLFTVSKYVVAQDVSLTAMYYPHDVFDIKNYVVEGKYSFGSDVARFGGLLRCDSEAEDFQAGVSIETTLLKLGEIADFVAGTALGFSFKEQKGDRFITDHHRQFVELTCGLSYKIDEKFSIKQEYSKQFYNQNPVTHFNLGVIYRLK